MATGTVKWFSAEKGFGFIIPDAGGNDIFVHCTALQPGQADLPEGAKVSYEIGSNKGKSCAINVKMMR